MNQLKKLAAYEVVEEKEIAELNATGCVLHHKKSGARIFIIPCDDDNKVFNIGFRTPPGGQHWSGTHSGTQRFMRF